MKKLRRIYKNLKFRYKLTLLILAAGIIPVFIIVAYTQYGMMSVLQDNELDNLQKSLDQSVEAIENQEQIYENLVNYLSYSQDLRTVLSIQADSDYETYLKYVNVVDPLLQMPQLYHREIKGITLYSENITVAHGDMLLPLRQAEEEPWYKELGDSGLMQWYVARGSSQEITAFRKFYNGDEVFAVLAISLDYTSVLAPFSNQLLDNTGGIVLDEKGEVVYASYSMGEKFRPEEPESIDYIMENYTCSVRDMNGTGWKFCIYRPAEIITSSANSILLRNVPLIVLCVILLVIVGYIFSKTMVTGLERLTENMNQIHLGFRKVTVSSNSNDEVGVLIRSFRRMMDEMNRLISEVYESKIKLQNSEMKALQAQINPHFLYNSLSIINWKAIEAGEEDISKVTLALSTYYRTSLNRGETMTTVENEVNNIRAYLKIQLIMHDNSFKVEEQYDTDTAAMEIPKLILQPLVENAIDHGIDMSEQEDRILKIRISQDEGNLLLSVSDNGVGMEQEKADQIITYQSSGYGVRNVSERIQVLYGEEGGVSVESAPDRGTTVTIKIPKKAGKQS
ncbi:MAG TPA: sensor histidine kinase [Candidatus Mediterraneibacter stercoripullorum]|nr:sensor histidine kinase [Candidatus Mediterraneibacter stercoripullorum]